VESQEVGRRAAARAVPDIARPESVYGMDLEEVLGVMRQGTRATTKQSHEFHYACLERLNQLVIERNSKVSKQDIVNILRELTHLRPKEEDEKDKLRR
jgi:septum formation inhibitor-activating ATPase MinD